MGFLKKYFGADKVEILLNHSLLSMAGSKQSYHVKVYCHSNDDYISEGLKHVRE